HTLRNLVDSAFPTERHPPSPRVDTVIPPTERHPPSPRVDTVIPPTERHPPSPRVDTVNPPTERHPPSPRVDTVIPVLKAGIQHNPLHLLIVAPVVNAYTLALCRMIRSPINDNISHPAESILESGEEKLGYQRLLRGAVEVITIKIRGIRYVARLNQYKITEADVCAVESLRCLIPSDNLGRKVFKCTRSMLYNLKVIPASCLVLVDVTALDQLAFESTVQNDVENIETE
ncbi:hypothetical protein J6590_100997, partial [Homalodisca vitripennis]